jgi:hypothetical protein
MSQDPTLPKGVSSAVASRAWTPVSTHHSWFLSCRSWDVTWFSKRFPVALVFLSGWYVTPNGPWRVVCAFGPSHFISDFAVDHRAWRVASQFPTFVLRRSSAFLQVIHLKVLATHLTALLHAGSQVTCHSFLNLLSCFSRLSDRADPIKVKECNLYFDSLYVEAIEAVACRFTGFFPQLILILSEINSEASLSNRSEHMWIFQLSDVLVLWYCWYTIFYASEHYFH